MLQLCSHALRRFSGKVEEWDGMCKHLVVYDDGDEEWVNLATDKIKIHAEGGETYPVFLDSYFCLGCYGCLIYALTDSA